MPGSALPPLRPGVTTLACLPLDLDVVQPYVRRQRVQMIALDLGTLAIERQGIDQRDDDRVFENAVLEIGVDLRSWPRGDSGRRLLEHLVDLGHLVTRA